MTPLTDFLDRHSLTDEATAIATCFGATLRDVEGKRKTHGITMARGRLMLLCRATTGRSYPEIGRAFGVDHSSVMAACRKWAPFFKGLGIPHARVFPEANVSFVATCHGEQVGS